MASKKKSFFNFLVFGFRLTFEFFCNKVVNIFYRFRGISFAGTRSKGPKLGSEFNPTLTVKTTLETGLHNVNKFTSTQRLISVFIPFQSKEIETKKLLPRSHNMKTSLTIVIIENGKNEITPLFASGKFAFNLSCL